MSITRYVSLDGSALVWYSSQPTAERDGDVWTYKFRAWCQRAAVFSLIPASGTVITDASFTGIPTTGITTGFLALTGVSVSANPSPEMVDVECSFKYSNLPGGSWGGRRDGEIEQRAETTVRDVPTTLPYKLGMEGDIADAAIAAAEAQIDTIPVPGLKYYYTLYTTSFGWTEADLIAVSGISIGEVGSPTGIVATDAEEGPPEVIATPTAKKWLLHGKSIENVGAGMVKVSEEWEYSPVDWTL